jgi:hypothetical protein
VSFASPFSPNKLRDLAYRFATIAQKAKTSRMHARTLRIGSDGIGSNGDEMKELAEST